MPRSGEVLETYNGPTFRFEGDFYRFRYQNFHGGRDLYLGQTVQVVGDGVTKRVSPNLRSRDLAKVVDLSPDRGLADGDFETSLLPDGVYDVGTFYPYPAPLKRVSRILLPLVEGNPYVSQRFYGQVRAIGFPAIYADNIYRDDLIVAIQEQRGGKIFWLGDKVSILHRDGEISGYIYDLQFEQTAGSVVVLAESPTRSLRAVPAEVLDQLRIVNPLYRPLI